MAIKTGVISDTHLKTPDPLLAGQLFLEPLLRLATQYRHSDLGQGNPCRNHTAIESIGVHSADRRKDNGARVMARKWAVVHMYDLATGMCFLARKNRGLGEIALFDLKEEAERWVQESGDIEEGWEINYIQVSD
jgi:hypothetical protein